MSSEKRSTRAIRRSLRPSRRSFVKLVTGNKTSRSWLNHYYNSLNDEGKSRFHARYARIYYEDGISLPAGEWLIQFAGQKIRLPLRPSWSWLDWATAVSVLGHDIEVKKTYAALVKSDQRPALFLDVGANYGTHSLLFLSVGIPIIAFEPNRTCLPYFKAACELNGFAGQWEQVAVGNGTGYLELVYPEKETWLGMVSSSAELPNHELSKIGNLKAERVQLKALDDYYDVIPYKNILIKIDAEGYEQEVIRGAKKLLLNRKPKLIFESVDKESRSELHRLIAGNGYTVHQLPWQPSGSRMLDLRGFSTSTATNFIAISD